MHLKVSEETLHEEKPQKEVERTKDEWITYVSRLARADDRRKRRQAFPSGAVVIPVAMSLDVFGVKVAGDIPSFPCKHGSDAISFYDPGQSIDEMAKRGVILSREQQAYENVFLYTMTYADERMVRNSALWKESEEPGFRQMILHPCYPGFSVRSALGWELAFNVLSLGMWKARHMSLRRIVAAMMLFHRLKSEKVKGEEGQKMGILQRPGALVSSSRIGNSYVAVSYDSVRLTLSLHDGKAMRPFVTEYMWGLAMER